MCIVEIIETIKKVLVPVWYKESQMGRSLIWNLQWLNPRRWRIFKNKLFEAIERLRRRVDDGNLSNEDIRKEIEKLSEETGASIGQSQKVINVYLKVYCALHGGPIEELDCPLDSGVMRRYKDENHRPVSLKGMKDFNEYEKWQAHLKEEEGIRLRADTKCYDQKRIDDFLE